MKYTTLVVSIIATLAGLGMSSIASGAVVVLNSRFGWDVYTAYRGATVATEDFESFAHGSAASATGIAGGTTWTANATGELYFGDVNVPPVHRVISTAGSNATLNFTFAPGVQGIGGEMFGTNAPFEVVLAHITVMISLTDGQSYVVTFEQTSASDFVGFYSNGAAISSLTVATSTPGTYVTVDNLYFATVPDADGDGVVDAVDNCPATPNSNQLNTDGDTRGDACDNCPLIANSSQADCNNNSIGDACDIASGAPDFNQDTIPDTCQCGAIPSLPACCPGDLDHDAEVGGADIGLLLSNWGPCASACLYDLNNDDKVNGGDLGLLLSGWGPCPN